MRMTIVHIQYANDLVWKDRTGRKKNVNETPEEAMDSDTKLIYAIQLAFLMDYLLLTCIVPIMPFYVQKEALQSLVFATKRKLIFYNFELEICVYFIALL